MLLTWLFYGLWVMDVWAAHEQATVNTLLLGGKSTGHLKGGYSVHRLQMTSPLCSHTAFQATALSHRGFQVYPGLDQGTGRNSRALGKDARGRGRQEFQSSNRGDGIPCLRH